MQFTSQEKLLCTMSAHAFTSFVCLVARTRRMFFFSASSSEYLFCICSFRSNKNSRFFFLRFFFHVMFILPNVLTLRAHIHIYCNHPMLIKYEKVQWIPERTHKIAYTNHYYYREHHPLTLRKTTLSPSSLCVRFFFFMFLICFLYYVLLFMCCSVTTRWIWNIRYAAHVQLIVTDSHDEMNRMIRT